MSDAILAPQTREYFLALAQLVQSRVDEYCCYMSSQQFNRDYKKLFGETPGRSTKVQRTNLQIFSEEELLRV